MIRALTLAVALVIPTLAFAEQIVVPSVEYTVLDEADKPVVGAVGGLQLRFFESIKDSNQKPNEKEKNIRIPAKYNAETGKYVTEKTVVERKACTGNCYERSVSIQSGFSLR